jgi:ferredoxin
MVNVETLREEAKRLLTEEKVKYIIGYTKGTNDPMSKPVFIKNLDEVEKLTWDPTCVYNLVRYLLDAKTRKAMDKNPDHRPVALVVKGCDSRAINVLLQEKFVHRDEVYIIGVSCENTGIVDEQKLRQNLNGQRATSIEFGRDDNVVLITEKEKQELSAENVLAERCLECRASFPVTYDVVFGENVARKPENPFRSLDKLESCPSEQRWAFWKMQFDKCIRCYACRSVCPMCYCDECVVDSINLAVTANTTADEKAQKTRWVEKSPVTSENFVYHMVRAIHLVGRCVDCNECERACPLNIPLRLLNKKLEKEAKELFGYDAGFEADQPSLVSCFKDDDPGDFIR